MPAFAYSCHESIDRVEIRIVGMEDTKPDRECMGKLSEHLKKPATFYFQSPGGYIDKMHEFVRGMSTVFNIAKQRSKITPTVVIHTECKSACVPILTGFNQLAINKKINLIVDRNTEIGFHGCSDKYAEEPVLRFTIDGTNRYLKYFVQLGGNLDWITDHIALFESPTIVDYFPEDPVLQNSGILNAAVLR